MSEWVSVTVPSSSSRTQLPVGKGIGVARSSSTLSAAASRRTDCEASPMSA